MQTHTSRNTSVNTWRLPAVFNKVDWHKLYKDALTNHPCVAPLVYDYGCGKTTAHIKNHLKRFGFEYIGYDKFWSPNAKLTRVPDVIVCSNVLNVIDSPAEVAKIQLWIRSWKCPFFITIYEGDKSYIGRTTKDDCWQANKSTEDYLFHHTDAIRNKVITHSDYLKYLY